MPAPLTTDLLIYALLAGVIAFAVYASRHEHLRAPWREVRRSRVGMASAVVLIAYVLVGLLDSVHLHPKVRAGDGSTRYAGEIVSVLDLALTHLRSRSEKTYSAPFAWQLYVKETVELPDGSQARLYPRLEHGGAHLEDPATQRTADLLGATAQAILAGTGLWLMLAGGILAWQSRGGAFLARARAVASGRTVTPWRVILLTCLVVIVAAAWLWRLSLDWHVLGTDKVGQDVLYQAVKSIRTGLVIGTLTTLVMLPFAILLGMAAGYFGGRADDVIQYLYTTLNSIPGVLLIAAAILMLQVYMSNHAEQYTSLAARADMRLLFLCGILGVTSWTGLCRLLRAESLKLREIDYIQAAHAFGVRHFTVMSRHILPNVLHIVMITVVIDFSGLVLAEAVLSYINIGVDPTTNSWGNMINSARLEMAREPLVWWSLLAAFVFMFLLVLAANLFADAVRDAFDPRLRTTR